MPLPPEPDLPVVHRRAYDVTAYRRSATELLLRGTVRDEKPAGLYFADDRPLTVHHMVVDLVVTLPSMEITATEVVMQTHPHEGCTRIEEDYQQLVGLSIARGFSRSVKDLFGGPRGCTHIGALLQAMAPVAIQSIWSMRALDEGEVAVAVEPSDPEQRLREGLRFNLNTCHIWDEEGEMVAAVRRGEELPPPVWAVDRLRELGRDPDEWVGMVRPDRSSGGAPPPGP